MVTLLPPELFAAVPALLVVLLKPLLDLVEFAGRRPISPWARMVAGLVLATLAFGLLALATALSPIGRLSVSWLLAAQLLLTAGEILVVPSVMALFAGLAPSGRSVTALSLFFAAQALSFLFASFFGSLWGVVSEAWFFALVALLPLLALLVVRWVTGRNRSVRCCG